MKLFMVSKTIVKIIFNCFLLNALHYNLITDTIFLLYACRRAGAYFIFMAVVAKYRRWWLLQQGLSDSFFLILAICCTLFLFWYVLYVNHNTSIELLMNLMFFVFWIFDGYVHKFEIIINFSTIVMLFCGRLSGMEKKHTFSYAIIHMVIKMDTIHIMHIYFAICLNIHHLHGKYLRNS